MAHMTGGEAVLEALIAQGIEILFVLPQERDEPALLAVKVGEMPDPWRHIHLPRVRG